MKGKPVKTGLREYKGMPGTNLENQAPFMTAVKKRFQNALRLWEP